MMGEGRHSGKGALVSREKKFGLSVLTIVGAAVVATAANDYLVPNGGVSPSIVIGAGILFAAALREIWRR
jgi:hypothetical protein